MVTICDEVKEFAFFVGFKEEEIFTIESDALMSAIRTRHCRNG